MKNSAPPPHVPQRWQPAPEAAHPAPTQSRQPYPARAPGPAAQGEMPPPAFDPRRAMAGSPPPANQRPLYPGAAPSAPPPFPSAGPHGGWEHNTHESGPAYGAAPDPQNFVNPQSSQAYAPPVAYDYPPVAPAAPTVGKSSLLSRLRGRKKAANSASVNGMTEAVAAPANNRKPFFMGLLTGVVLMLILGQVFRAANSGPDYAALPTTHMTPHDAPASDEPEAVAFLDRVEGLE